MLGLCSQMLMKSYKENTKAPRGVSIEVFSIGSKYLNAPSVSPPQSLLTLHRSCAGNYSRCEFMSAAVWSCPEDTVLL